MKQLKFLFLMLVASSLAFNGCKKEEGPIEYDVALTTDNTTTVKTGVVSITWTIQVHSARTSAKTSGLSGATVNTVGNDGVVLTAATDANGFATFTGMAQGIASATVTMATYTTVNITADLYTSLTIELGEDVTKFATSDVMLWPLDSDSKVEGVAYGNFDGDFVTYPNDTSGDDTRTGMTVYVTAMVGTLPFTNNTDAGQILEYTIEPNYWSTTSASSGTYSISSLPVNDNNQSLTLIIGGQEFLDGSKTWVPTEQDISGSVWSGTIIRNIQFK